MPESTTILNGEPINANREDSDSLELLCARYAPQGTRYAMAIVRNRADAEEIMQEAVCRLLLAREKRALPIEDRRDEDKSDGDKSTKVNQRQFSGTFFTTVRNLCFDLIRKRKTRPSVSINNSPVVADSSLNRGDVDELNIAVNACVDRLPDNWREALKLKIHGELSYAEIAGILDATHAQIRTWIFRARKQLEKDLQKQGWL